MRLLISMIFLFATLSAGCTKEAAKEVLCDTGKTASAILSAQIAVQLDCKNVDAIRADVDKKLIDLKVCEAPKPPAPAPGVISSMSAVGDVICKPVVDALFAGALTQIPATWGCTGGKLAEDAKLKILAACSKAL